MSCVPMVFYRFAINCFKGHTCLCLHPYFLIPLFCTPYMSHCVCTVAHTFPCPIGRVSVRESLPAHLCLCVCASACGECDPNHQIRSQIPGLSYMWSTAGTGRAKSQRPSKQSKRRQHRQRSNGRADWQRSRATGRPSLLKGKPSGHRTGQLQSRGGGRPRGRLSSNGSSSLSLYNMPTGVSVLL